MYRSFKVTTHKGIARMALSHGSTWIPAGSDVLMCDIATKSITSELANFLRHNCGVHEVLAIPEKLARRIDGIRIRGVGRGEVRILFRYLDESP
jgi:hypothetical protein